MAVIVDVLRFSTTVATALYIGVSEIIVRRDLEDAVKLARRLGAPLIAEVDGFKPDVADLDNSPTEIVSRLGNNPPKRVVVRSASGATVFEGTVRRGYKEVVVGGLVNAAVVAKHILAVKAPSITVVMTGFRGKFFAIEDLLGAGAIITKLQENSSDVQLLTDEAIAAHELYRASRGRLLQLTIRGRSGRFLRETGRIKDMEFCSREDIMNIVPRAIGEGNAIKKES